MAESWICTELLYFIEAEMGSCLEHRRVSRIKEIKNGYNPKKKTILQLKVWHDAFFKLEFYFIIT